ncbi:hypothetical protein L1987_41232 [Smallanthus sonchifolius]|uniref:Uncharacterized protein n=1 Tax=Smallanthus sonchifolius TaxID=185202 RepID=A0ACB9GV19_9ASTR|nr:hypothetical protein L1987_41232 [Smallanthus sonchifolius]
MIAPDWRQALTLRKAIEDRVTKGLDFISSLWILFMSTFGHKHTLTIIHADGAIGIGISATAVGLIAGGIAAALMRRH